MFHANAQSYIHKARLLLAVPAIVLLNASLTFGNVWPTPKIRWLHALSAELAAAVILLACLRGSALRAFRAVLPAIWILLIIGHYIDVTAPGLYGRHLNLYWDSRHLTNVAAMLTRDVPAAVIFLAIAFVGVAVAAAYALARASFTSFAAVMDYRPARRLLGCSAAVLAALFSVQQISEQFPVGLPFADPASISYIRQARYVAGMIGPGRIAPELGPSPELSAEFPELRDSDVLLVFLESYGAVTFDNAEFNETLAPSRRELESAVAESGKQVVSAFVESPTFGGSSWLAHLSLLSGVEVRDEYANVSLMSQHRDTLVAAFARNGYRTVALMPGIRQEWPEGAFYKFDVIYNHDAMSYMGPHFGWWEVPDQYALAKLDALELSGPTRRPVFAVFPTSTTHAPFGPVPPYQPDWSRVRTGAPYDTSDVERSLAATPDLTDLSPSYLRAIAYSYRVLAGYIRQHAGDNQLLIVIGDHQPAAAVSGRDASWNVPVHIVSSRSGIIDQLKASGFVSGLEGGGPNQLLGKMHSLVPVFLEAFGSDVTKGPADIDDIKDRHAGLQR